jgi:hypothetical protein
MSEEYIKQLEDTVERLKTRLESELMGKAVIAKSLSTKGLQAMQNGEDYDALVEGGQIVVGCVVFAKIQKRKDDWCGYVLESNGENEYRYVKFVTKCKSFDEASEKCIKALAIDTPTSTKIYSIIGNYK